MIPKDQDFLLLYLAYFLFFIFLLYGTVNNKHKLFKINLLIFIAYTLYSGSLFFDEENFKYGSSLAVLFTAGIFIIAHIVILFLFYMLRIVSGKKK